MIKGLAITPPVLGRISIGRVVEKNGIRLPQKDDQFTITSQIQEKDAGWLLHPLDEELRKDAPNGKLRTIPVRMLFNDADLNLRAEYTMFDRKSGRPMCVGNGDACKRLTQAGVQSLPCPGPPLCEFGKGGLCKPYGRLNVKVGDDDDLGTFIFRTTGYNSIRTLAARLSYYQAISGGLLAYMPLELKLRGKSTTQSHRTPIYYVDLVVQEGMSLQDAVAQAKETARRSGDDGLDQAALDAAAAKGFGNALFDYEEDAEVLEEFFPLAKTHTSFGKEGDSVEAESIVSELQSRRDRQQKAIEGA
ncbi:hydrolase or metal-binding protein [Marinobacter nauticus]|uniref:recombination directionality factor n=1 Tax=Marinobacter nauticus TaxID=2743 RepID=UPI001C99CD1E|nr:hydrolase or metal-binding protein [Marinobacter nauticus]MBY5938912.1 hydrolase or metal-binding protein [Marinobacter nauticus]MBY5956141.1 hydrolase or metal-binding protein [Marinobacter nauticus]MBY6009932.1 hydrolase or metal-binding protein [Marinobacter nauticus]